MSSSANQAAFKERMRQEGFVQKTIWVRPDDGFSLIQARAELTRLDNVPDHVLNAIERVALALQARGKPGRKPKNA